ncbi:hypothetical protein BDQ12DRAFT_679016 [Crucibulum laeve]|uniref:Inner centromere protein ARK-binding domain-containing protein n=1 Tax=Crucibulum laeve TaxID=68775 RepID=A0A5C3M782_9AGAR|nr:hypothetical protein BDQ12DRAFT_679016 [Crucibulum laeve]
MAQVGLLDWANSLRLTMATDPGRQLFQEQVQTHGFLFLEDYLDNILSGARQDPLIELVKTPGRKKAIARKPKLANVVTLSLEDDDGKENDMPINNFHKALLGVKADNTTSDSQSVLGKDGKHLSNYAIPLAIEDKEAHATSSLSLLTDQTTIEQQSVSSFPDNTTDDISAPSKDLSVSLHVEQNELSAIAEDDEGIERSRVSMQLSRPVLHEDSVPMDVNLQVEQPMDAVTSFSSVNDFHSILLDSPAPDQKSAGAPVHSPLSSPAQDKAQPPHDTASLPEIPALHSRSPPREDIMTAPLPDIQPRATASYDMDVPLRDPDAETSNYGSVHKSTVPAFPTLPEPMPLRKSMRALRDASMGTTLTGAATPGAAVGGKRTSWLMKAREVKALEATAKKLNAHTAANVLQMPVGSSAQGLKRKSGDSTTLPTMTGLEDEERKYKASKQVEGEVAPLKSTPPVTGNGKDKDHSFLSSLDERSQQITAVTQDGVLDRLKKTVEGLGARVGMGKSLAGTATSALAEARAAAEARIAERNHKEDEMTTAMGEPSVQAIPSTKSLLYADAYASSQEPERRLSISDLFPADGKMKEKHRAPEKVFQAAGPSTTTEATKPVNANRESTSTTPPNSPPSTQPNSFVMPPGPVFNKPPPVFVAPAPASKSVNSATAAKEFSFDLPANTFSMPAAVTLGISPRLHSPTASKLPLTAHSTMESMKSDAIFDDQDDVPAWVPSTQETEYSTAFNSQSQLSQDQQMDAIDEDDSWPIDEKLAAGVQWTFGANSKEDSMTWSTLPSQSQRADTGPSMKDAMQTSSTKTDQVEAAKVQRIIPGAFDMNLDNEADDEGDDGFMVHDSELEDIVLGASKSTVSLVESKTSRSQSAMSMASSASSQSQVGFFGQASKLLSSALGTSKKAKQPEVKKVMQMAAVAAKKQEEEASKKAARLKEMENRRQLAQQRKVEEEKARAQEQERKVKEDGERRKREREEHTDKRPIKPSATKKEDDTTKKRKLESEKKPELKKPAPPLNTKSSFIKPSLKQPNALSSSTAYNSSIAITVNNAKAVETSKIAKTIPPSSLKGKGKLPTKTHVQVEEDDISQPSQVLQTQMAARAKAQIQAAKQATEPIIPSESIELPDINSEYSDSDDENRVKTFDPPDWAQSPELRQALQVQSTINPDDIFGAVRPLRMEELFKTRTSRFRARTSSANWTGADRLTLEEEREYARRMGFR